MTKSAVLFLDTSALISRLLNETAGPDVQMLIDAHPKAVFFSALSVIEVLHQLARQHASGGLSDRAYEEACERFGSEVRGAGFVMLDFKMGDFAAVSEITRKHGLDYSEGMRLAIMMNHLTAFGKEAVQYVCSDEKLLKAARAEGFRVFRPGAP